ncbi:hypothetical protein JQ633_05745 [Bradyrhizobium tropiciagri]|uniref:hypothetical protein n=1 Tax=Bradyrhizobium tropiciagri TaxID=312253 RepID=UPI001BA884CE|nr:hypothetical protein [Bradyrhizobium tropiciagri]MBR0869850.1 hypothetical protein [Bradyrhizobium tropiciagri]
MRLTGWILLLIGALACATIAWAAVGFLLMGVGLIALQVAERRKRRAEVAPAAPTGLTPPSVGAGLQPPVFEPVPHDGAPQRLPRRMAWPAPSNDAPYDREAWRRLVESDSDIAQIANVLADYGPQYVDELAASYLAMPDKSRLAAIVDGIVARARDTQPAPPPKPIEASRPPPSSRPVVAPEGAAPKPAMPKPDTPKPDAVKPAAPPPLPANPADALEASLIAAVEASTAAKAAAERSEPGGASTSPRGAFGRAAREQRPDRPPPPVQTSPPADIEASLIAAVTAAKRAEPLKPAAPPEPPPAAAKPEPEIRRTPGALKPAAPPVPPPAPPAKPLTRPPGKAAADDLDESLLAALAEISGQKPLDPTKPEATSKDPPADDELSAMIKKFAPDSSFLRKQ